MIQDSFTVKASRVIVLSQQFHDVLVLQSKSMNSQSGCCASVLAALSVAHNACQ